mmetsp:Transcript_19383/g.48275  ORF Transcript_19383/g.48275 Transcript_19383/m.48275 type:complete len:204 (-) Transcript_19383:814-1425(-)
MRIFKTERAHHGVFFHVVNGTHLVLETFLVVCDNHLNVFRDASHRSIVADKSVCALIVVIDVFGNAAHGCRDACCNRCKVYPVSPFWIVLLDFLHRAAEFHHLCDNPVDRFVSCKAIIFVCSSGALAILKGFMNPFSNGVGGTRCCCCSFGFGRNSAENGVQIAFFLSFRLYVEFVDGIVVIFRRVDHFAVANIMARISATIG